MFTCIVLFKAEAVAEKIGYADSILNNTVLNEEYNDVNMYFLFSKFNLEHNTVLNEEYNDVNMLFFFF